jgi:hypothetical protein
MLLYNGIQYIEGIDAIRLRIRPYLYGFINIKTQIDTTNFVTLQHRMGKFQDAKNKTHHTHFYLICILGEYINPHINMRENIANAIALLFEKNAFRIPKISNLDEYYCASKEMIINHLSLFVDGIAEIEFCFDFKLGCIHIPDHVPTIKTKMPEYYNFLRIPISQRSKVLFKEHTTYYSFDLNWNRLSILKYYHRDKWLLKKRNEYPQDFIKGNLYKRRIEFRLLTNYNTKYLTLNNMDGTYDEIMERYIELLAILYNKYFGGLVFVNDNEHPNFGKIYEAAQTIKSERYRGPLENVDTEKNKDPFKNDRDRLSQLYTSLYFDAFKQEKIFQKNIENKLNEPYVSDERLIKLLFDRMEERTEIDFEIEGYAPFYKNDWILPWMLNEDEKK